MSSRARIQVLVAFCVEAMFDRPYPMLVPRGLLKGNSNYSRFGVGWEDDEVGEIEELGAAWRPGYSTRVSDSEMARWAI